LSSIMGNDINMKSTGDKSSNLPDTYSL